jgi:hypothetical protein
MTLFKKLAFIMLFAAVIMVGSQVYAQDKYGTTETMTKTGGALPDKVMGIDVKQKEAPTMLVGAVVSVILEVIGIVFFVLIFWSGFNWMTARGNAEKIDKSKDGILDAVIGLVVVMAAYAITNFVFDSLAVTSNGGSSNTDAACTARSGVCAAPTDCTPTTQYHIEAGLCPGGTDNVCCVPNSP